MKSISELPNDVLNIIKDFLPYDVLFYTSKKYFENFYIKYRLLDIGKISKKSINNLLLVDTDYYINKNYLIYLKKNNITNNRYLNMIIRNDLNYILQNILKIKYNHWKKLKNYYHNGIRYPNYICFLESHCMKYNSNRCRNIINNVDKNDTKLRKKRYKKIRTITNRWTA